MSKGKNELHVIKLLHMPYLISHRYSLYCNYVILGCRDIIGGYIKILVIKFLYDNACEKEDIKGQTIYRGRVGFWNWQTNNIDSRCFRPGLSRKGDYIEEKWIRKKKEFVKLHIAVDAKSKKVVSFRITKGKVHDTRKFCPLVREAAEKYDIDKVHADKAHDNRKNFNLLGDDLNIEPAIGIRKNATIGAIECPLRRDEVLLIKKLGY
jgi:Transposase DDE domain